MRSPFTIFRSWQAKPSRLRIRSKERILFAKRLSLYLRAGIPILDSLELLRNSHNSKSNTLLLSGLVTDTLEGIPLSHSLAKFPRAYEPAHLQLIAVGEASGTLVKSLSSLASSLEERSARLRAIASALTYPVFLLFGSCTVSVFLLLFAFPKIVPLFKGLHSQLPFTTRTLLGFSMFLQHHWMLLLGNFFILTVVFSRLRKLPSVKSRLHPLLLKLPFMGKLIRAAILATVFRTLATLLSSGVRLDEAIRMTYVGLQNVACRAMLERVRKSVLAGSRFSSALAAEPLLFPPVALQLIAVGEMTGSLSESAASAAEVFDEELSDRLRVLSSLLEPIIMISMGVVIGFIALAIISPMYSITQSLAV